MTFVIELFASALILIGAFFALVGSIGLIRLPDFFSRLHAPTKASTLGIGAILIASMMLPLARGTWPGIAELMLTLFVFISAPIAANMLALSAIRNAQIDKKDG